MRSVFKYALWISAVAVVSVPVVADKEMALRTELSIGATSPGSLDGAPELRPLPPGAKTTDAGTIYYEYFNYSAYAKRTFVPGYTPHRTSLFENPREYPWALCVMATPYINYAGIPGWFFASPQGYQSSVPPGSHALKYYRGELGVTAELGRGYPNGLRVIEPAIEPVNASVEHGGIFIKGGDTDLVYGQITEQTLATTVTTEIQAEAKSSSIPPRPYPLPEPTLEK